MSRIMVNGGVVNPGIMGAVSRPRLLPALRVFTSHGAGAEGHPGTGDRRLGHVPDCDQHTLILIKLPKDCI